MNYLNYWSLRHRPFLDCPRFFKGVAQREAMSGLNDAICHGYPIVQLLGRPGCGMTFLLRHARKMRGFDDCAAEVVLTSAGGSGERTLRSLAASLGLSIDDRSSLSKQIGTAIDAARRQQLRIVWLLDDAGRDAEVVSSELSSRYSNLTVIVGRRRLHEPSTPANDPFKIPLAPIDREDTLRFIRHALRLAGSHRNIFHDGAATRIFEISSGAIADVARIAETALAVAATHGATQIDATLVDACQQQRHAA